MHINYSWLYQSCFLQLVLITKKCTFVFDLDYKFYAKHLALYLKPVLQLYQYSYLS